jgi:hypothetical protein
MGRRHVVLLLKVCSFVFTYLAPHDICRKCQLWDDFIFPNSSMKASKVTYLLKVANNDQTTHNRIVWFMYNPTYMSSWPFIVYSTWKYIGLCKDFKVTIHLILNKLFVQALHPNHKPPCDVCKKVISHLCLTKEKTSQQHFKCNII